MMRADAFRSLLFVLLAAGVVWAFAAEKIKKTAFVLLLGVLVTADMVPVNLRYLNGDTFVLPNRAEIRRRRPTGRSWPTRPASPDTGC